MGVYINFAQGWDPALLMPFVAPKIESVSVVMTLALGSIGHFPVSSLTRLVLHHYQYRDCEVSSLLAATPKLRYLEYHALVEHGFSWGPRRDLGLEIVYGALHNISDTLEELVATQIYVSNDNCFEGGYEDWHPQPDLHVENLTSMKCLRSLSLPYMSLLGRTSREASNWEWHKVLPSSLRSLTLTSHLSENECNYEPSWENEDEDLMATFMTLLDWMAVDETRGQQSAFALIFDGLCDQHFPNRQQQQELDLLCKERHIQFSLTKLPWGKYPGQRWPPA
nr:hypothetical protein B0A51_06266 [Rachicladosporium sp. CCFEE 5018]